MLAWFITGMVIPIAVSTLETRSMALGCINLLMVIAMRVHGMKDEGRALGHIHSGTVKKDPASGTMAF